MTEYAYWIIDDPDEGYSGVVRMEERYDYDEDDGHWVLDIIMQDDMWREEFDAYADACMALDRIEQSRRCKLRHINSGPIHY